MPGPLAFERADVAGPRCTLPPLPFLNEEQGVAAEAADHLAGDVNIRVSPDNQNDCAVRQHLRNWRLISDHRTHPAALSPAPPTALSAGGATKIIRVGAFGVLNAFNDFEVNGSVA